MERIKENNLVTNGRWGETISNTTRII